MAGRQRLRASFWDFLFVKPWPPLLGVVLLTVLALLLEVYGHPWRIVEGLSRGPAGLLARTGLLSSPVSSADTAFYVVINWGFVWGAFVGACLSQRVGLHLPPVLEVIKALIAGIFLGCGAALAMGSNIGGCFVSLHNLAANGLLMFLGLLLGIRLGVSYLVWETEHLPCGGGLEISFRKIAPVFGFLALAVLGLLVARYATSSLPPYKDLGKALALAAGMGYVMYRSRFCFYLAFKEPFLSGEASAGKAAAVGIIFGAIGVTALHHWGILPANTIVSSTVPSFGPGALLGGFVFGLGMVLAGGCGAGILWRAAEGQVKMWLVVASFAVSHVLANHLLQTYHVIERGYLGKALFLPNYLGYLGGLLFVSSVVLLYCLVLYWNEKTHIFTLKR